MDDEDMYLDGYQQQQRKDEVVQKSSFAMRSEERLSRRKADETSPSPAVPSAEDGGVKFLAPEGMATAARIVMAPPHALTRCIPL